VAPIVGFLFIFALVVTAQASPTTVLTHDYIPLAIGGALASLVLVPVLVYAWDPLSESMAG